MKKQTLAAIFSVSLALTPMAGFADADSKSAEVKADASTKSAEVKAYVKDSVITTKVKAKLAADHPSTLTKLEVNTDNSGTVYLSGNAPTATDADRAVATAMSVDGVRGVKSEIIVKP
jgi:hyperosmotically inducible protein